MLRLCVCVRVGGVYDPELSDVLIFPCASPCLRPPTAQLLRNAPFFCSVSSPWSRARARITHLSGPGQIMEVAVLGLFALVFFLPRCWTHVSHTGSDLLLLNRSANKVWVPRLSCCGSFGVEFQLLGSSVYSKQTTFAWARKNKIYQSVCRPKRLLWKCSWIRCPDDGYAPKSWTRSPT